jgi:hypothetical protein
MSASRNRTKTPVTKVTTAASSPVSKAMQHLDTYMKPFVDPDIYAAYHPMIGKLETRGPKEAKLRKELHARLKKLVWDDGDIREMHNECAKVHNKRFEGKHARYLLPIFGEEEEKVDEAAGQDTVMSGVEMGEEEGASTADKVAQAVEEINEMIVLPTTERDHVSAPAALSYLAWLHQRGVRFPDAYPRFAECIALGKQFGRIPRLVYDEVLFHWGLETDSKFGKWYRENRLEVLGDDPIFGE